MKIYGSFAHGKVHLPVAHDISFHIKIIPCYNLIMKKVLAFDVDQTLNIAKTPITDEVAEL